MTYGERITEATVRAMTRDPKVVILGVGVTDPKGIFGTTLKPRQLFPDRVIETPVSENMLSGACMGLALEGWTPIFVHARCDFMTLTMEHLINTIAKWRAVHQNRGFGLVMRTLVGRGWGQGPNHSQAFHSIFAHIPGLRVLYPVDPESVGDNLEDALTCGWPTVILEPRRLYDVENLDHPQWEQPDAYVVTFGDVVLDAAMAAAQLYESGIKAQVYPVEDVSQMAIPQTDLPVVVADTGHLFCGATAEVVARLAEGGNTKVKRVGPPFVTLPTSVPLEREWYPDAQDISSAVCSLLDVPPQRFNITTSAADDKFKGPF
jgi:pyruvate/2-oxoglutarate/acetoin dehydrogenase E1 component